MLKYDFKVYAVLFSFQRKWKDPVNIFIDEVSFTTFITQKSQWKDSKNLDHGMLSCVFILTRNVLVLCIIWECRCFRISGSTNIAPLTTSQICKIKSLTYRDVYFIEINKVTKHAKATVSAVHDELFPQPFFQVTKVNLFAAIWACFMLHGFQGLF